MKTEKLITRDKEILFGDRKLSYDDAKSFIKTLNCWTENGTWEYDPSFPSLYPKDIPLHMQNFELNTQIYSECGPSMSRSDLDYVWKTPTCPQLPVFTPESMCREMRGRSLIFVGDSLTIAHFETTIQAMAHSRPVIKRDGGTNGCPGPNDSGDAYIIHAFHFCQTLGLPVFNVTFVCYNNILEGYIPQSAPILQVEKWKNHLNFLRNAHDGPGIVLVVNRGAHVRNDKQVALDMVIMMAFVREELPQALLIFRSSNMAHGSCRNFSRPRTKNEPLLEPSNAGGDPSWQWSFFPAQSARVIRPIILNSRQRGIFLDIFPSMQLRPDSHTLDCLHYCVPGPIDMWVRWVYAIVYEVNRLGI